VLDGQYKRGWNQREIGARLGITPQCVGKRQRKAMARLTEAMMAAA